jgi:hypothetical protein
MNLVVEILGQSRIRSMLIGVASGSNELLQLDTSNEVLILRCHETIILRQQEYLVVTLRPLRIFQEEGGSLLLRKVSKLLGVGDNMARARRTRLMARVLGTRRRSLVVGRDTVWVL